MASKDTQEKKAAPQTQQPSPIDRVEEIREIIFGSNIRQYNQEFQNLHDLLTQTRLELEQALSKNRQELDTAISKLKAETDSSLEQTHQRISQEVSRLDHAKTDREALGQMLIQMGQQLIGKK